MRLLLLAGAGHARHVALALWREPNLSVTVSLTRTGRRPESYAWPVRIGEWDSDSTFRDWLEYEGFDGLIDASHPFDNDVSRRAASAARLLGVEYIRYLKPFWVPTGKDRWTFLNLASDAASHIPERARVFFDVDEKSLTGLKNLNGRKIYWRSELRPENGFPFPSGAFLLGSGPYTVDGEQELLETLGVDWLIARNTGGQFGWPTLEAARKLRLNVAVVRRPPQPEGPRVTTVAEALAWVRRRT